MSAFIMVGIPGIVYSVGIGAYGWGSVFFLTFPVTFATVGYRLWLTGKKFGHITPGDLFDHRYDSRHLGTFVMLLMTFWTIPYIVAGAQGAGNLFQGLAGIPYWAGALLVVLVVFVYVNIGGMRGTAWTNTFQGAVMIVFIWALLVALATELGGFVSASGATMDANSALASRPGAVPVYGWQFYFSWIIVFGINTLMNPHMFQRILPGFNVETLKRVAVLYPIGLMLVWIPPNIIGFWGAGQLPDLASQDLVLPVLVGSNFGPLVGGLAMAGILAALMSTMDGQSLSVSNLFERDLIGTYADLGPRREVWLGRIFVGLVLAAAYVIAYLRIETIVGISQIAFTGYALMFLPLMIGFYWRRANAAAAWAGLIVGFVGFWAFELGWLPATWTFGFTSIVPLMVVQIVVVAVVPYVTSQPPAERVNAYFDLFDGVW
jgi:SSS family solute:Na+ symporter